MKGFLGIVGIPQNCWIVGNEGYARQHDHNETRGLIICFTDNRLHESDDYFRVEQQKQKKKLFDSRIKCMCARYYIYIKDCLVILR